MNVPALIVLIWFGLVATASAQGTPTSQLSAIRSVVSELEGRTDKLHELNAQYRSLVEQRPQPEDGSPEAKKAQEAQLAKWNAALDRLLRRIDQARTDVVATTQRLDQLTTGPLPTSLAKDVANARNEAGAERSAAEQALKSKPAPGRTPKPVKQSTATEKAPPPIPDDL
jgi:hypothetical protein